MQRIELPDFLLMAEPHVGIAAEELARMPRVVSLASSALAAPFAGFGPIELHPEFSAKAAMYLTRIATYHPLPDGNKRTAYDVSIEFIERNGGTFAHENNDLMATAAVVERIAASLMDERAVKVWMAQRITT